MSKDTPEFVHKPPRRLVSKHERESKAGLGLWRELSKKYTGRCRIDNHWL